MRWPMQDWNIRSSSYFNSFLLLAVFSTSDLGLWRVWTRVASCSARHLFLFTFLDAVKRNPTLKRTFVAIVILKHVFVSVSNTVLHNNVSSSKCTSKSTSNTNSRPSTVIPKRKEEEKERGWQISSCKKAVVSLCFSQIISAVMYSLN